MLCGETFALKRAGPNARHRHIKNIRRYYHIFQQTFVIRDSDGIIVIRLNVKIIQVLSKRETLGRKNHNNQYQLFISTPPIEKVKF
jgi:hypothetical protein